MSRCWKKRPESLYQKNRERITAEQYEGLCLKLLDLKKFRKLKMVPASGTAARKYTGGVYVPVKTVFYHGEKENFSKFCRN